jgi:leucyl aminopeptidase (aminopeptidase T)
MKILAVQDSKVIFEREGGKFVQHCNLGKQVAYKLHALVMKTNRTTLDAILNDFKLGAEHVVNAYGADYVQALCFIQAPQKLVEETPSKEVEPAKEETKIEASVIPETPSTPSKEVEPAKEESNKKKK